jgi:hypothetical protein
MFWSFEVTRLLARDRISQMQREVERDRLVKQVLAARSGPAAPGDLPSAPGREDLRPLLSPDSRTVGLEQPHPLPAFTPALSPVTCNPGTHGPSKGGQGES